MSENIRKIILLPSLLSPVPQRLGQSIYSSCSAGLCVQPPCLLLPLCSLSALPSPSFVSSLYSLLSMSLDSSSRDHHAHCCIIKCPPSLYPWSIACILKVLVSGLPACISIYVYCQGKGHTMLNQGLALIPPLYLVVCI